MSNYYLELVQQLAEQTEMVEENSVQKITKAIPDYEIDGELDPRVLLTLTKAFEKRGNSEKVDWTKVGINDIPIEAMRSSMGWSNKNVTTTEITTKLLTIEGENGQIPVRVYSPKQVKNMPAIIYFHGGGFIGGTLKTVQNPCKALAEKANAVVISVDYRLAPEHPFPAGLVDCFDSVKWVYSNSEQFRINRDQLTVCGDSAGGNLATVCALLDKVNQTNMIKYQALIYPVVNLHSDETEDYKWDIEAYNIINDKEIIHFTINSLKDLSPLLDKLYLQGKDSSDPYVSPILSENLSLMPEALIITAEYDALRLEAEAYAKKMAREGVNTTLIEYKGMDHAFIDKIGLYPQAEDCMNEIAKGIKNFFKTN